MRLLPKGDLQYCNSSLTLTMIAKIGSFKKKDISDPCIESIRLKTKCYSIFQLHILSYMYYLIVVRQYFAIVITLADQNHAISLLQWNVIVMYAIYGIIAQP